VSSPGDSDPGESDPQHLSAALDLLRETGRDRDHHLGRAGSGRDVDILVVDQFSAGTPPPGPPGHDNLARVSVSVASPTTSIGHELQNLEPGDYLVRKTEFLRGFSSMKQLHRSGT